MRGFLDLWKIRLCTICCHLLVSTISVSIPKRIHIQNSWSGRLAWNPVGAGTGKRLVWLFTGIVKLGGILSLGNLFIIFPKRTKTQKTYQNGKSQIWVKAGIAFLNVLCPCVGFWISGKSVSALCVAICSCQQLVYSSLSEFTYKIIETGALLGIR